MQVHFKWVATRVLLGAMASACASTPTSPPEAAPSEVPEGAEAEPPSDAGGNDAAGDAAPRPQLTAEECEAQGGTVVGDIGDGAVHRPDYTCPGGAAPTGNIMAAEGEPMAVEGAVCCPE